MRVTFVCLEWPNATHTGGVARYAFRLATTMKSLVKLTVVTFAGGEPIDGVDMIFLPRPSSRFQRYYATPFALRTVVKAIENDVIHSFGDDWAIRRSRRVAFVRTFLGSSLAEARSSSGLRKINHYFLALTEIISARRSHYRVAIGPDSFAEFKCHAIMPPVVAPVEVIGTMKTVQPSVVFIGSFHGRKRGALVERAVSAASERLGSPVLLRVIGPESDKSAWKVETVHVADATDLEVSEIVSSSWVLMAPSRYEGFGIPTFEAIALKTPVIASENPGSLYILEAVDPPGILSVVSDSNLGEALIARLRQRAVLSDSELSGANKSVTSLLRAAAAERLIAEIYPAALASSALMLKGEVTSPGA